MPAVSSVTPLGIGGGVGEVVAEAVRVVRDSGCRPDRRYITTVEGAPPAGQIGEETPGNDHPGPSAVTGSGSVFSR